MKKHLITLSCFLLLFSSNNAYAQHTRSMENSPIECGVMGGFVPYTRSAANARSSSSAATSAFAFYNNLQTWIPRLNEYPLKNPPITYIEISFHVFLDDNGGNSFYTNYTRRQTKAFKSIQLRESDFFRRICART